MDLHAKGKRSLLSSSKLRRIHSAFEKQAWLLRRQMNTAASVKKQALAYAALETRTGSLLSGSTNRISNGISVGYDNVARVCSVDVFFQGSCPTVQSESIVARHEISVRKVSRALLIPILERLGYLAYAESGIAATSARNFWGFTIPLSMNFLASSRSR